jgi:hypothetical protein
MQLVLFHLAWVAIRAGQEEPCSLSGFLTPFPHRSFSASAELAQQSLARMTVQKMGKLSPFFSISLPHMDLAQTSSPPARAGSREKRFGKANRHDFSSPSTNENGCDRFSIFKVNPSWSLQLFLPCSSYKLPTQDGREPSGLKLAVELVLIRFYSAALEAIRGAERTVPLALFWSKAHNHSCIRVGVASMKKIGVSVSPLKFSN